MNHQTIAKLQALNQQFYQQVAYDFNQSRQYAWKGWEQLLPWLTSSFELQLLTINQQSSLQLLDLGCGNARFAKFIDQYFSKLGIQYLGVDNQTQLLTYAQNLTSKLNIQSELVKLDLISSLIKQQLTQALTNKYHLITMFGLLHHIPSYTLRQSLFDSACQLLDKNGILIVTSWQFIHDKRLPTKIVDPKKLKIQAKNLDPHDYILSWNKGVTAYRYCHYTDQAELEKLIDRARLKIKDSFFADGKSGLLNQYVICAKR